MTITKQERRKFKKEMERKEEEIKASLARKIKPKKSNKDEEIKEVVYNKFCEPTRKFCLNHPLYCTYRNIKYDQDKKLWYKYQNQALEKLLHTCFDLELMYDEKCCKCLPKIALYCQDWMRNLEDWKPKTHNRHRQIAHLLRWLFVKYDMPLFMDTAWYEQKQNKYISWYIDIGKGGSVYKTLKPYNMTRKMAHLFVQSPKDLSITEALRWTQTLAYGGDQKIAHAIVKSELPILDLKFPFWMELIHLFARSPMMDAAQIGPVVDYVRFQKAQNDEYTLKGRTINSLIKHTEDWHQGLVRERRVKGKCWEGICLPDWKHIEGKSHPNEDENALNKKQTVYKIVQILNGKELAEEGRSMCHCVYSYSYSCERGQSSIWSLRKNAWEEARQERVTRRLLTIEVRNRDNTISQVRGKYNRTPNGKEIFLLKKWAEEARLRINAFGVR